MLSVTQPWLAGIRLQTGKVVCLHVQLILGFHLKLPANLPAQFWWVLFVWYKSLSAEYKSHIYWKAFFLFASNLYQNAHKRPEKERICLTLWSTELITLSEWLSSYRALYKQQINQWNTDYSWKTKYIYYHLPDEKSCYQISFLNSSDLLYMRKRNHFLYLQDLSVCSQSEKQTCNVFVMLCNAL